MNFSISFMNTLGLGFFLQIWHRIYELGRMENDPEYGSISYFIHVVVSQLPTLRRP